MSRAPSLTVSADPTQDMPASPGAQVDRIERAIHSLNEEERRLMRLGFELPLARCREQRRYWEFLKGVIALAVNETGDFDPREIA